MVSGIEPRPFSLRDARFVIEAGEGSAIDYTGSISHALFAPSVTWGSSQNYVGGTVHQWVTSISWSLAIEYPQSWQDASALSLYLALHQRERRTVRFTPQSSGGTSISAEVTLAPGPIGGQAGPLLTGIVVMGVNGEPVIEGFADAAGL